MDDRLFFMGRIIDPATGKPTDQELSYDPANLTTHGIITGMTGSGKTALGIVTLEEAALHGIPAIVIDPKGDMTNLLMHFPDLEARDFEPWVDPETARREGTTTGQLAAETAKRWEDGISQWGMGRERLAALRDAAQFTIFTPGSTSGVPVNVLASFSSPDLPWQGNEEILRERVSTIVTALLTLVGVPVTDPLRSREHILLANVLEDAWRSGRSLDLSRLILETHEPPFDRLGAFPLESVYPKKERAELAMLLNNFLASPSFQTWMEGQTLDVGALLFTPEGRPKHNVFYLAHLNDQERMFFVTLLFAAVESWMRGQRGTGHLRLLVYFDEIMGYMPPVANPPSRPVMLRMLKQARAFGIGILVATQNPVDVDYKGLSNAGTWLIGRLQTEQDKARLMEGLRSASGDLDIKQVDKIISGLAKRTFFLHSVHRPKPAVFATRHVLNYLAGPVTRAQIPGLNRLAGATKTAVTEPGFERRAVAKPSPTEPGFTRPSSGNVPGLPGFEIQPEAPGGAEQVFLPIVLRVEEAARPAGISDRLSEEGIVYRPALYAKANIRYLQRKYDVDHVQTVVSLVAEKPSARATWDQGPSGLSDVTLEDRPVRGGRFEALPAWLDDAKSMTTLEKDFTDWVYQIGSLRLQANESLKVYAPPGAEANFRRLCEQAADEAKSAEMDKLDSSYQRKIASLRQKADREQMKVNELQSQLNMRRAEEIGSGLETVISLFGGRRRSIATNLSKRRMTSKTDSDLQQAQANVQALQRELNVLEQEKASAFREIEDRWAEVVEKTTEVTIPPAKKDIFVETFAVAWVPHHIVRTGGRMLTLPAFKL